MFRTAAGLTPDTPRRFLELISVKILATLTLQACTILVIKPSVHDYPCDVVIAELNPSDFFQ